MTTSHKIVLSLVAAICITLIVFYSVQGNAQYPAVQRGATAPEVATGPKTIGTTPLDAATPPAAKAAQTPVIVGRAENPQPTGLDDLVAKVRTELATTQPAVPRGTIAPAPATEPVGPVASANAPAATQPEAVIAQPAPAAPATPSPAAAEMATAPTTPRANAVAQVPSFTLGEPAKELPAPGGASVAAGDGPKMPYDINLRDLADMPVVDGPLVPLVRVRSNDEPAVIVVDPHQPAVKAADPVIKDVASATDIKPAVDLPMTTSPAVGADLAPSDAKAATNSQAEAPRPITPVNAAAAPVLKTYTIKAGDSFSSIATAQLGAEKHWIDIADANPGVDPKRIRVGQVINLPDIDKDVTVVKPIKPEVTATAPPVAPPVKPETVKTPVGDVPVVTNIHEVKAGENLSNISRKYFNTPDHWRHIYVTNREVIGGDPGKLQAGLKLKITTPPKSN